MIYVVFENGIEENEWWILAVFTTLEDAKDYADGLIDKDTESHYRIVEYVEGKVIKELG